jgi:hypothetical protein
MPGMYCKSSQLPVTGEARTLQGENTTVVFLYQYNFRLYSKLILRLTDEGNSSLTKETLFFFFFFFFCSRQAITEATTGQKKKKSQNN